MAYRPLSQSPKAMPSKTKASDSPALANARARTALLLSQASLKTLSAAHWAAIQQSGLLSQELLSVLQAAQQSGSLSEQERLVAYCASRFHFQMPEEPVAAVEAIEQTILELTGAEQC